MRADEDANNASAHGQASHQASALDTDEDANNAEAQGQASRQASALDSDEESILTKTTVTLVLSKRSGEYQRRVNLERRPASNSSTISDGLQEIEESLEQSNRPEVEYLGSQFTRAPLVSQQGREQVVHAGRVFCPTCTERPEYLEYSYREELIAIIRAANEALRSLDEEDGAESETDSLLIDLCSSDDTFEDEVVLEREVVNL